MTTHPMHTNTSAEERSFVALGCEPLRWRSHDDAIRPYAVGCVALPARRIG